MRWVDPDRRITGAMSELVVGFAPTLFLLVLVLSCFGWVALTLERHHDWFMSNHAEEGWETLAP